MRSSHTAVLALACWLVTASRAQDAAPEVPEAGPELDFLEYLGAWAEEDEEWLAIDEWRADIEAEEDEEQSEIEREDDDESE
jgi:hypothetical protein